MEETGVVDGYSVEETKEEGDKEENEQEEHSIFHRGHKRERERERERESLAQTQNLHSKEVVQ